MKERDKIKKERWRQLGREFLTEERDKLASAGGKLSEREGDGEAVRARRLTVALASGGT
jgi:hypothetical protein